MQRRSWHKPRVNRSSQHGILKGSGLSILSTSFFGIVIYYISMDGELLWAPLVPIAIPHIMSFYCCPRNIQTSHFQILETGPKTNTPRIVLQFNGNGPTSPSLLKYKYPPPTASPFLTIVTLCEQTFLTAQHHLRFLLDPKMSDYHKFLFWSRANLRANSTTSRRSLPICKICSIHDPKVQDDSVPILSESISSALDSESGSSGNFVVAVVGDFRDINKRTLSWYIQHPRHC